MTTAKEIIGRIIKRERERQNMTLQELADRLGADRQYIWRLENGRINMTLDYLDKIIQHLKCRKEDFFNINSNL
ncbi:MAG: helix-turn-helix domain-containing protein [Cyclobacteriaceae bacterium]